MKRCHRCERELPPEAFHRDRSKPDGRVTVCVECLSALRRARRRERAAEGRQRDREALRRDPTAQRALPRHSAAVEALRPDPDPEAERIARIAARAERELRRPG